MTGKEETPVSIKLLNDYTRVVLDIYTLNFDKEGKNVFKELAQDEFMINYSNLLFKTGDLNIENFNFLKKISLTF